MTKQSNQVTLRVEEGIQITPEFFQQLKMLFEGRTIHQVSFQRHAQDYITSYQQRIDSLQKAVHFLLKAMPIEGVNIDPKSWGLSNNTIIMSLSGRYNPISASSCEEQLKKATGHLVSFVATPYGVGKKCAIEMVNKAEMYYLASQGRGGDLATLSTIEQNGQKYYALHWDSNIPFCHPLTHQELAKIQHLEFQTTPDWFRQLDPSIQMVFQELTLIEEDRPDYIGAYVKQAGELINSVKSPEYNENLRILQKFFWDNYQIPKIELDRVIQLPYWFLNMTEFEQRYLKHILSQKTAVLEAIQFAPSRLRTIPLLSNAATPKFYLFDPSSYIHLLEEPSGIQLRTSHLAPRDYRYNEILAKEHTVRNIGQLDNLFKEYEKEKKVDFSSLLLQTLISPIKKPGVLEFIPGDIPECLEFTPDRFLDNFRNSAFEYFKNTYPEKYVISVNHPVNALKNFSYTGTENILPPISEKKPFLQAIFKDYELWLQQPAFNEKLGRELHLATLEELYFSFNKGAVHGTCVSGKDRRATQIIYENGLRVFYHLNQKWPNLTASVDDRKAFAVIVAQLYLTRHMHVFAGHNAQGADGIKSPDKYFPQYIIDEINQLSKRPQYTDIDNMIASTNELSAVAPIFKAYPKSLIQKIQQDESKIIEVLDILKALLGERMSWATKNGSPMIASGIFAPASPTGISAMFKILEQEGGAFLFKMFQLCEIARERVDAYFPGIRGRDETTQAVYNFFINYINGKIKVDELKASLNQLKNDMFKQNEEVSATRTVPFQS